MEGVQENSEFEAVRRGAWIGMWVGSLDEGKGPVPERTLHRAILTPLV